MTGRSWHDIFHEIVAEPLGLEATEFVTYYSTERRPSNPLLAVGAISSVGDMERFLRMLINKGRAVREDGSWQQVLSSGAVADMTRVQPGTDRGQARLVRLSHFGFSFLTHFNFFFLFSLFLLFSSSR